MAQLCPAKSNSTAKGNNMVNSAFSVAKAEFIISYTFYFLL